MPFCKFNVLLITIIFNSFFISYGYISQLDIWNKWDQATQSYRYMFGLYDSHIDFYKEGKEIGNEQWKLFVQELKKLPKEETICIVEARDTQQAAQKQFLYGIGYAINNLGYKTCAIDYRKQSGSFIDICRERYESNEKSFIKAACKMDIDDADVEKFLTQENISFYSIMHEIENTINEIENYNDSQGLTEWYKEQIQQCLQIIQSCIQDYLESMYTVSYSIHIPFWKSLSTNYTVWINFLVAISHLVDCKAMHEFFINNQKYVIIIMGGAHLKNSKSTIEDLGWKLLFSYVGKKINDKPSQKRISLPSWLKESKPTQEFVPFEFFDYISNQSKIPITAVQTKKNTLSTNKNMKQPISASNKGTYNPGYIPLLFFYTGLYCMVLKLQENNLFPHSNFMDRILKIGCFGFPLLHMTLNKILSKQSCIECQASFNNYVTSDSLKQFTKELENKAFLPLPCLKACIRFSLKNYKNPFHFFIKKIDKQRSKLIAEKEEWHENEAPNYIDNLVSIKQQIMKFDEFIHEEKNSKIDISKAQKPISPISTCKHNKISTSKNIFSTCVLKLLFFLFGNW